jgi:hypothetical protein
MFVEVLLVLADVLAGVAETWLLLTLPIDIIAPIATAGIRGIGRNWKKLSKIFCSGPKPKGEIRAHLSLPAFMSQLMTGEAEDRF